MFKVGRKGLVLSLLFLLGFAMVGCEQATDVTTTSAAPVTTEAPVPYFIAGNFNGYVPNEEEYRLEKLASQEGWYIITVSLTAENRDNAYDGHYYKITDGTWTVTWGTESYALQPAPASPTGGGLGSIWIYENRELSVLFDSNTGTIYDNSMVKVLSSPIIYGDFNEAMSRGSNWSIQLTEALVLTEGAAGIYEGEWVFPAYQGAAELGYSLVVCTELQFMISEWGNMWVAKTQYVFDGSAAAMGLVSNLKPTVSTTYHFSFNSVTKVTTVTTS